MAIDRYSMRIGAAVNMAIRLFEPESGAEDRYRPALGPAAWHAGEPTLWEMEKPGDPGYRRIWTVVVPRNAKLSGAASNAFELAGDPPRRLLTLPDLDEPNPPNGSPALVGSGGDANVLFPNVLARKLHLRWNSHRVADEADIELPLAAMPLPADGSVIRSVLVEVRVGVIDADAWARALSEGAVDRDGRPLSLPVADDSLEPAFAGFVDDHTLHLPESGASTVRFKARDMSALLADEQCRGRSVETDCEIDYAIARLLSSMPSMIGMSVHWIGPEEPPTLGGAGPKWKRRTSKKGKPLPLAKGAAKQSMLDLITEACVLSGVMPRFVGYRLELGSARTMNQFRAQAIPRMVLGQNVLNLEMTHKLTRAHAKAIEVRSFNPDTGRICCARWPPDPNRKGDLAPGVVHTAPPTGSLNLPPGTSAADEQSPEVMVVENVTSAERLEYIAHNAWEERARQDITGKFTTRDFATIEGRAQGLADLLSIRAGDPIAIVIAPDVEQAAGSYLQRIAAMGRAEAIGMLRTAGWTDSVAEKIVDAIQITKRPLVYRVREADLKLDMSGGTELDVSFQNFIEVLDPELRGSNKGGNRARLKAAGGEPSFAAIWHAIDLDREAGELSDAEALKQQQAAGALERERRRAAPSAARGAWYNATEAANAETGDWYSSTAVLTASGG